MVSIQSHQITQAVIQVIQTEVTQDQSSASGIVGLVRARMAQCSPIGITGAKKKKKKKIPAVFLELGLDEEGRDHSQVCSISPELGMW